MTSSSRRKTAPTWAQNTPNYIKHQPELAFPFESPPQVYVPQITHLKLANGTCINTHLWCFLERTHQRRCVEYNIGSLSVTRAQAIPKAIDRLSKWFKFKDSRPATIEGSMRGLAYLLNWADGEQHEGRFERIFSDPDLALLALKGYHTNLRQRVQGHKISAKTAADKDQIAIAMMSQIHDRIFLNDIEPLTNPHTGGTQPPRNDEVATFMSVTQAVFDSVITQVFSQNELAAKGTRVLHLSATDDAQVTVLPETYSQGRLMELGCIAFAALAIGDSGTNLAQIQMYEEPDNLEEQLSDPDRVNLTQRQIKFRAGGKSVPVHLTTTTLSRIRAYLRLREALRLHLGCPDVRPMFVQSKYTAPGGWRAGAHTIGPLNNEFLAYLRTKFEAVGAQLPNINLRQLRLFKQQNIVRKHNLKVAADVMGHSVATAIRAYSKAQEDVRQGDMGAFLSSLAARVLRPTDASQRSIAIVPIPAGGCEAHGQPLASEPTPLIQPDCKKTEGCFFCDRFYVHADENDTAKLLSCREVVQRLGPMQGESAAADRVYGAVLDRIDALLKDICRIAPEAHEHARAAVLDRGNLTTYWATKLQQLYLLGLLARPNSS